MTSEPANQVAPAPDAAARASAEQSPGGSAGPYLELYKLAVEMADRTSARRTAANSFFVTLDSAFLAAIGLVQPNDQAGKAVASTDRFGLFILALAGVIV